MKTSEACDVAVDLVKELSRTRRERDAYRLIATQALALLHDRHVEATRATAERIRLHEELRAVRTPPRRPGKVA